MTSIINWNEVKVVGQPKKEGHYMISVISGTSGIKCAGVGCGYFYAPEEGNDIKEFPNGYWDTDDIKIPALDVAEEYCIVVAWAEMPEVSLS